MRDGFAPRLQSSLRCDPVRPFATLAPVVAGAVVVAIATALGAGIAVAQDASPDPPDLRYVYASEEQVLVEMFPGAATFVLDRRAIGASLRARIERRLERRLPEDQLYAYLAYDGDDAFLGYAVVTEEIGKYRPITFMVAVDPDLQVREAQVLVYRESRGMEVRRKRFLHQYVGKTTSDALRINRDIINVTGATLSVRAMNRGVERVLVSLQELYGRTPPSLSAARSRAAAAGSDDSGSSDRKGSESGESGSPGSQR